MADKGPTVGELAYSFFKKYGYSQTGGEEKQVMIAWRGNLYLWECGVYRKIPNDEMVARIVRHLGTEYQLATISTVENVKLNLASLAFMLGARVPNSWFTEMDQSKITIPTEDVVTNSAILSFMPDGTIETKELTPDFFALGKLPYDYDPDAVCPRWNQFLDEITVGNTGFRRLLQEWAGYLLTSTQKYQTFLLLLGEAGTGKGVFSRAMKAMLGAENCSEVSLRRFGDRFSLYSTYGKKLNISGDVEEELDASVEIIIKMWTGRDGLDYECKYSTGFQAPATAKLMMSANSFPAFVDKSCGTWRRLLIIPFKHVVDQIDINLDETLRGELPGILNWAIEGRRLLEEKGSMSEPPESKALKAVYRAEANPAVLFLAEKFEYNPDSAFGVETAKIYMMYRKWCLDNGYRPLSDRQFGREVFRAFPQTTKRSLGNLVRYKVYSNLKCRQGV